MPKKQEELKELCLQEDYYTVMANDIIKGKQNMSVQQARLLRLMITQVVKQDKDFMTYKTTVLDLAQFLKIDVHNMYRDIRQLCDDLLSLKVKVGTGNPKEPWEIFQWVQLAKYDGEELTLMLSNQIAPFALALEKNYTQYKLKSILSMKSFYTIRLYELLKCDMGTKKYNHKNDTLTYTIKELREYFCCEDKLKQIVDFRNRVIERAVKEINKNQDSDIYILYETNKPHKKVLGFIFHFMPCADAARNGLVDWGIHWQSDFEKPVQFSFNGDENE